jgi:hypothetical protein
MITKLAGESAAEWAARMNDAELSACVLDYCEGTLDRAVAEEMVKRLRGGARMHGSHWLDIDAVRKRIDRVVPTATPRVANETRAQTVSREIQNGWLSEWEKDRSDLHRALHEIEMLRKLDDPSSVLLLHRWTDAREATAKARAAEAAEKLVAFVR